MTTNRPKYTVDVVLATYNSADDIDACLASLTLLSSPWRLLVADNGSSDDTISRVMTAVPNATVVRNANNLGFGQAINAAVSQGSGDLILVLNPDATLAGDPSALFETARDENVILTGLMSAQDGGLRSNAFQFPNWSTILRASKANIPTETLLERLATTRATPVDYVEGSFFVIKRETMVRLGGFSPSYFMYGEDRDLSRRARAIGVPTKVAGQISHRHDGGFSPRRQPWYVSGILTYTQENTPKRLALVKFILLAKFVLKLVVATLRSDVESAVAARATIAVLRGRNQT